MEDRPSTKVGDICIEKAPNVPLDREAMAYFFGDVDVYGN
jgi:hypothetical protein